MPVLVDRVLETVSRNTRPSYIETSAYSQFDFSSHKRHREQVTLRTVLSPIKYADTAYVYINNTRRRYVSKTYYEPRLKPKLYQETTFTAPKAVQERYVSFLDYHTEESKKWYKTRLDLKAKNFVSSYNIWPSEVEYPSMTTAPSFRDVNHNASDRITSIGPLDGNECPYDVNENMNNQVPVFREVVDPGASQVFIPKPRRFDLLDDLLQDGQILVNIPNGNVNFDIANESQNGFSDV